MIEAWGTAAVYAAEAELMAVLEDGELMARAVDGLVEVAQVRLAQTGGQRVVALVGTGNNGADALYAAARLAQEGYDVAALTTGRVHGGALAAATDAGVELHPYLASGSTSSTASAPSPPPAPSPSPALVLADADLVLDGILGIGGRLGLPAWAAPWVEAVPDTAYVIAVDTPSGQDPSGESPLNPAGVFADETVTFSVVKPVHVLPPANQAVGALTVVDIGLSVESDPAVVQLQRDDVAERWPVPGPGDDKYSRGVVGIVAGGEDYSGAAVLCVTSAVAAGAGMVRYVGTPTPTALVRAAVPEAVHGVGRVQAWVLGPGLDVHATGAEATSQLAAARDALAAEVPVVLDAGGLDLLDGPRSAPTLLTPHAGEAARLLTRLGGAEVTRREVEAAPVVAARNLAEVTGASVLLKGASTIVVSPDEDAPVLVAAEAPAWLATAGAGDVLAGLAGTLLAAGLEPAAAGAVAAVVHGVAADEANPGGPVRALAVAHHIPRVVAGLLRRPGP